MQDPGNLEKFNLKNMHHIRNNIKLKDPEEEKERASSRYTLKHMNNETRDILNTLDKSYKSPEVVEEKAKPVKDIFNSAHYSTGLASASFTSTAVQPSTKIEAGICCHTHRLPQYWHDFFLFSLNDISIFQRFLTTMSYVIQD